MSRLLLGLLLILIGRGVLLVVLRVLGRGVILEGKLGDAVLEQSHLHVVVSELELLLQNDTLVSIDGGVVLLLGVSGLSEGCLELLGLLLTL